MYEKFEHVKTQLIFTGGVAEKIIHVKTQLKYVKKNTYLDITRIQPNPQPVSITQPTQPTHIQHHDQYQHNQYIQTTTSKQKQSTFQTPGRPD